MPDEKDDQNDSTEDVEQLDSALDEDLPTELPDDPVELKKFAESAISRLTAAQQRETALQSERDRLKESEEEQRTKANYWSADAQAKRDELARLQSKGASKEKDSDGRKNDDGLDDDTELAVAVTEGMTLKDIDRRAEAIARRIVKQTTDNLSQQGAIANSLTASYPDLKNSNSPLAKATIDEMARIAEEEPGMTDAKRFELATFRSAGRLGIAPKTNGDGKDKPKESDQKERERLRRAQGGPTQKATPGKGAIVITDADRAEARKMNGGQDVPDAVLKQAKQFQQEREQYRDQARA